MSAEHESNASLVAVVERMHFEYMTNGFVTQTCNVSLGKPDMFFEAIHR